MLYICTHIRAHVNICTRIKVVSTSFQQFLASRVLARLSEVRTGTEVVRGLVNSPCNRSGIIVVDQSSISLFLSLSLFLSFLFSFSLSLSPSAHAYPSRTSFFFSLETRRTDERKNGWNHFDTYETTRRILLTSLWIGLEIVRYFRDTDDGQDRASPLIAGEIATISCLDER